MRLPALFVEPARGSQQESPEIRVHVGGKHVLSSNALLIKQTEQVVHGIRIGNDSVLANSHSLIRMLQRDFAPLDLHSQHESFERIKLFGQHSRVSYMPNQDIN